MSDKNQLDSGWDAWGNHVLATLEKLENKVDGLEDKMSIQYEQTDINIITLKAKAGIWGSIAGVIASLITSLIVGLLVFQLTHGQKNNQFQVNPQKATTPAVSVLPPKEDPLAGFDVKVKGGT